MDISIQTLRDKLEPFLYQVGSLHYRFGAGLTKEFPLRAAFANFPELGEPESFLAVREAIGRKATDALERERLGLLLEFLAGQVEDALCVDAAQAVAALEAGEPVAVGGERMAFHDALAQLARSPMRERRAVLEQGLADFLWEHQDPYARLRESASQAAARLGYSSYVALREAVSGDGLMALAAQCEVVLRQTEDAYRDVLSYALKKVDPSLRPLPGGAARKHDLQHALTAPWLAAHYRREDLMPATLRWLGEMGFDPYAQGRIQVDSEERAGKSPRAFVADLQVPNDIRLVVRLGSGLTDAFALLHEFGRAMHLAHLPKTASVEERRLGDPAVSEAYAASFDHVLLEPAWHKRYLRLPDAVAQDGARLVAFSNLVLLRRYCARLPFELALYERGPLRPLAEAYADRQAAALMVGVPKGFYLYDVDPHLYATRYLTAWALEAGLHGQLRTRFNEDYWRNPATGRWLQESFAQSGTERAPAVAKAWAGTAPSLEHAAKRLVEALNR